MRIIITAILLSVFAFVHSAAQQNGNGLNILEVSPSATELSRAETRMAVPNGAASIYSNPALLAYMPATTIDLTYTSWIADFNNLFGGVNLRKGKRAIAFAFYSSSETGFEQRDAPGASNGSFSLSYLSLAGSYAYDFNWFSAGISAQYLNENFFLFRASGYAINLGLSKRFLNDKITLGTSLTNLGEMEELNTIASQLPSSFNTGISLDLLEFAHPKKRDLPVFMQIMTDLIIPLDETDPQRFRDFNPNTRYANLGLMMEVAEVIQVNAGYKLGFDQEFRRPYALGLGIIADELVFNYAFVPFNTGFGTVHSVGIQYKL